MAENEKKERKDSNTQQIDEIEELKGIFRMARRISLVPLVAITVVLVFFWLTPLTLIDPIKRWIIPLWWMSLVVCWGSYALKIVKEYEDLLVQFFGKYLFTWKAGPRIVLWPFMTVRFVKMWEEVYDIPEQEVITEDNVRVTVDGLIYFKRFDAYAATFNIANLVSAIGNLALTNLRNEVGNMEFDKALTSRAVINKNLEKILNDAAERGVSDAEKKKSKDVDEEKENIDEEKDKKDKKKGWGTKVTRVEIKRIEPIEEAFRTAMARQASAERNRRAMIKEAEGEKQATILIAQGEKEARINLGEGEKKRLKKILEGIAKDNTIDKVIQLDAIKVLPKVADGKATKIYLPAELAGIAKIAELFKAKETIEVS